MIPIILYVDKIQMWITGKLSLFSVQMSLSIFTEAIRCTLCAWCPLGFIVRADYFFNAAERNVNDANVKNERVHTNIQAI